MVRPRFGLLTSTYCFLLFFVIVFAFSVGVSSALPHCEKTQIADHLLQSNVINLVYTMESSCRECVQQAVKLPRLKRYLDKKGIKTHMIVGVSQSADLLSGLVPHVQVNNRHVWRALGGQNDHFYVIDRCGRMVFEIVNPWSNLTFPFVRSSVVTAQHTHRCGLCPADYLPQVPKREVIVEYPEQSERDHRIPEGSTPMQTIVKIRHRHRNDPKIYDHVVKIADVPEYHGHLQNDGHIPEERGHHFRHGGRNRHHGHIDISMTEAGLPVDFKNQRGLSTTEEYRTSLHETETNERASTESILDKPKTKKKKLEDPHPPLIEKSLILGNSANRQNMREKSYSINNEGIAPDINKSSFPKNVDQTAEKVALYHHYKHILDWIKFSSDYDYE